MCNMQKAKSYTLGALCYCSFRLACESCPFPTEQRSWSCSRTAVCALRARPGDGPWHLVPHWLQTCGCTACLPPGTLLPVPGRQAGDKAAGSPRPPATCSPSCCCLFCTSETSLHGRLAGKVLLWCLGQLQGTEHRLRDRRIESCAERRSLERFLDVFGLFSDQKV